MTLTRNLFHRMKIHTGEFFVLLDAQCCPSFQILGNVFYDLCWISDHQFSRRDVHSLRHYRSGSYSRPLFANYVGQQHRSHPDHTFIVDYNIMENCIMSYYNVSAQL